MFISQEPGSCELGTRHQEPSNRHMHKKEETVALLETETGQLNSFFGPYNNLDLLSWMRLAASDPSLRSSTRNLQKMQRQVHWVRKLMMLSNTAAPQRKRKLDLFFKERSTSLRSPSQHRISKMKTSDPLPSLGSSISSMVNTVSSSGCFLQKTHGSSQSSVSSLTSEDNVDGNQIFPCRNVPVADISPVIGFDATANSSKTISLGSLIPDCLPIVDFDEVVPGSSSTNWDDRMNCYLKKPRRSIKVQNFVGDNTSRMVIPVGRRFQADVPEWSGPSNKGKIPYDNNDLESVKWLGVQLWPIKTRNSKSPVQRRIGRGRADSCSCTFPGSVDCIKLHITGQRNTLKTSLGSMFYSMKFDEMGEDVAKSWTSSEQEKFKSIMKSATLPSNNNGFWKKMFKCFPSKCSESIISYYFNVYIPRVVIPPPDKLRKQVDAEVDESDDTITIKYMKYKGR